MPTKKFNNSIRDRTLHFIATEWKKWLALPYSPSYTYNNGLWNFVLLFCNYSIFSLLDWSVFHISTLPSFIFHYAPKVSNYNFLFSNYSEIFAINLHLIQFSFISSDDRYSFHPFNLATFSRGSWIGTNFSQFRP